ncbi:MAG: aspartate kinase [Polyangiaceae bacterium]
MAILVQKYGGSSVADVDKIGAVADKVALAKRAGNDVVVVVSAMGKATDGLLALAKSVAGDKDPPRRELDMLLSTGERVSMALLSIALHARGLDAISFTGSQSGIITNDRHFDARIIEVRPHRIEDELARGRIVIVAGYQGMSYRREITTLGRGGSDTTAVALSAALGAERCEIYSDVDGVYTADPRVVPDAKHLPELSLEVLSEMAEAGAKVLNAQAVEWARRNKVAIHARKTADGADDGGHRGRETIAADPSAHVHGERGQGVRAIVGLDKVVSVASEHRGILDAVAKLSLPVLDVAVGASGTEFFVPLLNVPDWDGAAEALRSADSRIKIEGGFGLVSLVGDGLLGPTHCASRFQAVLLQHGVTPMRIAATPLRIAALVKSTELAEAQRALHAAFV